MTASNNIVILGAGFGGLRVALDLIKHKDKLASKKIILLDKRAYHLYSPLLYEVATGYFEKETAECEGLLLQGVCVLIERFSSITFETGVEFISCNARKIDKERKKIICDDGREIDYEYLVIAIGSEASLPPIPGLKDYSIPFKTVDDALKIRRKIQEFIDRKRQGVEEHISVVIGGAGATGVELASELTGFVRRMVKKGNLKQKDFSITLIEAGNRVLGAFHQKTSEQALKRLNKLGVRVFTNTSLREVKPGAVIVVRHNKDKEILEEELESDITIWAGGVVSPSMLKESAFEIKNGKGRLEAEQTLQVKGESNIFVIGDCAFLIDPKTGREMPQLARIAITEGKVAARNIINLINQKPLKKYKRPLHGAVIPMAGKWALAELGPFRIKGFLGYVLRKIIDLKYLLSIMPPNRSLIFWWRGARIYIKND